MNSDTRPVPPYLPEFGDGADLIAGERDRQIRRGYDAAGDDLHTGCELAVGAELILAQVIGDVTRGGETKGWPISCAVHASEKHKGDIIRRLVIAGALIAAEIDRLIRAAGKADRG